MHRRDAAATARSISEGPEPDNAAGSELCIVVPVLDEAACIDGAVRALRALDDPVEIVVADGGSRDDTVSRARAAGARVVKAPAGRGPQMNAGAAAARAGTLLFLHADCRLPAGAPRAVRAVLDGGCGAGLFTVRYDSRHPVLRLAGTLTRFETPITSFGEGALFVRRALFETVGGFPNWPLLEDVELLARLRRVTRIGRARGTVQASARRFRARGVLRQQARNATLLAMHRMGVPPERLQRYYGTVREEGSSRGRFSP